MQPKPPIDLVNAADAWVDNKINNLIECLQNLDSFAINVKMVQMSNMPLPIWAWKSKAAFHPLQS